MDNCGGDLSVCAQRATGGRVAWGAQCQQDRDGFVPEWWLLRTTGQNLLRGCTSGTVIAQKICSGGREASSLGLP